VKRNVDLTWSVPEVIGHPQLETRSSVANRRENLQQLPQLGEQWTVASPAVPSVAYTSAKQGNTTVCAHRTLASSSLDNRILSYLMMSVITKQDGQAACVICGSSTRRSEQQGACLGWYILVGCPDTLQAPSHVTLGRIEYGSQCHMRPASF
jgi:hypothetical protein